MDILKTRITRTNQGYVQGRAGRDEEVTVFRAVPYAAPPVGPLRWRPPQPPVAWQGVRPAGSESTVPLQERGMFADGGRFDSFYRTEDCLTVDIWTPADTDLDSLPVMIWIFGGRFQGGYASDNMYDSELLAAKGVVCVTVNMRVGVFGYLCHPELLKEGKGLTCGNYGLLDIIEAVKWVSENIKHFGGNPNNITLVGQSTGALSLCRIVASGLLNGLYKGLILQSGDSLLSHKPFEDTMEDAMVRGSEFAKYLGADSIDELRALPPDKFIEDGVNVYEEYFNQICVPIQDRSFFKTPFKESLFTENTRFIPMIIGSNADDGFMIMPSESTNEALDTILDERFGSFAPKVRRLYSFYGDTQSYQTFRIIERDYWFARIRFIALAREKMRHGATWQYYFTQPYLWPGLGILGAVHVSELPYVFGSIRLLKGYDYPWDENNDRLFQIMSDFWIAFIKNSNPNKGWLPIWHPRSHRHKYMEIGLDTGMHMEEIMSEEKMKLWTEFCMSYCNYTVGE